MKRKNLKKMLGLAVIAAIGMINPEVMAAEETETVETELQSEEAETERETESKTTEKKTAPDVEVQDQETKVILKNESGMVISETVFKDSKEEKVLILTEESGAEHTFENVDLSEMKEIKLTEEDGFLFIRYQDAEGEEKTAYETAEEREYEKPATMYVVNDVYIRKAADGESEALGVASLGSEIQVVGASPKWYKVKQEEVTGYVARSFLSKDKEAAESAVKAEEAAVARAQAEAAAAAAAAQQAAAQAAPSAPSAPERYEVSRVAYDDCDGSGHGYYEITYSDGTTAIEEY